MNDKNCDKPELFVYVDHDFHLHSIIEYSNNKPVLDFKTS